MKKIKKIYKNNLLLSKIALYLYSSLIVKTTSLNF